MSVRKGGSKLKRSRSDATTDTPFAMTNKNMTHSRHTGGMGANMVIIGNPDNAKMNKALVAKQSKPFRS